MSNDDYIKSRKELRSRLRALIAYVDSELLDAVVIAAKGQVYLEKKSRHKMKYPSIVRRK